MKNCLIVINTHKKESHITAFDGSAGQKTIEGVTVTYTVGEQTATATITVKATY